MEDRSHNLSTTCEAIAKPVMIYLDRDTGQMYAAGDPNAGRHTAAL